MTLLARRPIALARPAATCLLLIFGLVGAAAAQESQHIAAVVNDQIISAYDLEQRVTLALVSSGAPNTEEQRARARESVLRGLVDEALQMQAAKAKSVEISDQEVSDAVGRIAEGNNIPPEQFAAFLGQAGIAKTTLEQQIRTQLAWQKLVGKELGPRIAVGQESIDEAINRAKANIGQPEMLISEIFLPVDTSVDEPKVKAQADSIVKEVRGGSPFRLLARQYSQATTAATGGDLGWVGPGQLPEAVEKAASGMQTATVSDPIRAGGGYYIIGLRDKRQVSGFDPTLVKLDLKQIVLPIAAPQDQPATDAALAEARKVMAEIRGCGDLASIAKRHGATAKDEPGKVTLADVQGAYRNLIEPLGAGQAGAPAKNGNAYQIIVVCTRENPTTSGPSRETITDQLEQAQLNMLARRYLRDLRRDATIEAR